MADEEQEEQIVALIQAKSVQNADRVAVEIDRGTSAIYLGLQENWPTRIGKE